MSETVLCYFRSQGDCWEALCVDYDIAVQGDSYSAVRAAMAEAISTYIDDAMAESEPARSRLLNRRVPVLVQLRLALTFLLHSFRRGPRPSSEGRFELPCHA